jgi:DNA-binding SARP family transcriptional activator
MEFRVLGPVEVVRGEGDQARALPIPAARRRALLALLLLQPNRLVSREVLIDHLWNGAPPDGAIGTLQSYVSRLRGTLGLDRDAGVALVSGPDGRAYRLEVDPERIDAARFERLVGDGREALAAAAPDRAAAAFDAALALWRDRPLGDLAGEYPFADQAARRLAALRAAALEGSFQAAGALGRLPDVVDQVQRAAAEHPDHAGLRELEMLALHQAGRTAEALAVYHEFRRVRGEQGLDPERALADLERRILRQDPALDPARPSPGLIGRAAQLARLRAALEAAGTRRGRLVLLHGEAGIGKSTLAGRLAEEAAVAGVPVGVGSPLGADGAAAFRPWIQALGALGARGARALLEDWRDGEAGGTPTARERQFEAVTGALTEIAADRPVVLLLDDLHDADAPSLRLLEHVARRLHGTRLLVLGLARDGDGPDPAGDGGWPEALRRVRRVAGVEALALAPLDDAAVAELVAFELGRRPGPELLAEVAARARGNPLFAAELTRLLADDRVLAGLRDTGGRLPAVPPLVREVVRDRAGRLPPACRELLGLAAVLGFEFELPVLAAAGADVVPGHQPDHQPGRPGRDPEALLLPAVEARIVEAVPGHPDRLRFRHPLVHEALEHQLPPGRREALHRRAAEAIEAVHGAWLDLHAGRLAAHWRLVGGADAQANAVEYAVRASRQARSALAWEEAARVLSLAVDGARQPLPPPRRCELLIEQGDALMLAGEHAAAGRVLLQAADLARQLGNGRLLALAALAVGERNAFLSVGGGPDFGIGLLETALRMLGEERAELRARLLACLSSTLVWAGDRQTPAGRERREVVSAEALALARRLGDGRLLARALGARIAAIWSPANPAERLALAGEGLAAAAAAGAPDLVLAARRDRAVACLELGDLSAFRAEARTHAAGADERRQPGHRYWASIHAGTLAMAEGRFDDADAAMLRTLAIGNLDAIEGEEVQNGLAAQLLMRLRERGRLDGAAVGGGLGPVERSMQFFIRRLPELPAWRAGVALLQVIDGRDEEAREGYEALAAPGLGLIAPDAAWSCTMIGMAELCAYFGDAGRAGELRTLLLPYADRCAVITFGFALMGSVSHHLGMLAALLGDHDEAEAHFRRALATHRRMATPPLVARTQVEYAAMLLGADLPAARERAAELLAAGGATARRLDMAPLAARATGLTAAQGA